MLRRIETEAPPDRGAVLSVGSVEIPLPDWMHDECIFATYLVRQLPEAPEPIDAGLVGGLVGAMGPFPLSPSTELVLGGLPIYQDRVEDTDAVRALAVRAYRLPRVNVSADLLTLEILLLTGEAGRLPDAQPVRHEARYFAADDLGFGVANERLVERYAARVGDDLLQHFTTHDDGDAVVSEGALLPVLGVHMWSYRLIVAGAPLPAPEASLLGTEVLFASGGRPLEYRLVGDGGRLAVLNGRALSRWSERRRLATLPWPDAPTRCRLRGFVTGPHGEGLVPTYVLEPVEETGTPVDPPPIDLDLGDCWEQRGA